MTGRPRGEEWFLWFYRAIKKSKKGSCLDLPFAIFMLDFSRVGQVKQAKRA
jgi:hypothetical protein